MRLRNTRVRTKVTALLVSLTALWVFAAWVTLREGVNILWVTRLDYGIAQPAEPLITSLQQERRLSLMQMGGPTPRQAEQLSEQRKRTDTLIGTFKKRSSETIVRAAADEELERRIDATVEELDGMSALRASVDGTANRKVVLKAYSGVVESIFFAEDAMATLDDDDFADDTRTLIQFSRAREILSQEDAYVSGIIASRRLNAADHADLLQIIGYQRSHMERTITAMEDADPVAYAQLKEHRGLAQLSVLENNLIQRGGGQKTYVPQMVVNQWDGMLTPLTADLEKINYDSGDRLVDRATPIAVGVIVRLLLAGGLGFLAVVASVVLSVTTARHLVRQLERLRDAAHELSDVRLPRVVERLGHGEQVDVAAEAPPLAFGDDDIGKVGQAFNAVQETAIRTAVEQAELRRGIRDILLSLARRSQALVHRQLTLLDQMERREIDTEELEDLFRLDHLATRMRRNAENLIILSGATPARGWRRPVPMVDVVRSAVAEVEDYTRVTVMPIDEVNLVGRAVADIAHLLAELIENAVSFSPPYTYAQISGHMVASGYALEIEDRGLGMSDENLASINRKIADPPEFNLSSSVQLGLYVVGKLAERYGVQVTLKRSPYKGTTAVVIIPRELLEEGESGAPSQSLTVVGTAMPEVTDSTDPRDGERFTPVLVPSPPEEPQAAPASAAPPLPVREGASAAPPTPPETELTPSGLPVRVPQASLAPALKDETADTDTPVEDDPGRSPEEIRRIVGAFQSGTLRGRAASVESETE
ncbi:sensor histidine kinase [Actinocorallia libanotica]|uniref:histidine kinase n=1 Tax=Actinocorallia libanotica TaxID=46162 RepID=A0ABN1RDN0_9ACTN